MCFYACGDAARKMHLPPGRVVIVCAVRQHTASLCCGSCCCCLIISGCISVAAINCWYIKKKTAACARERGALRGVPRDSVPDTTPPMMAHERLQHSGDGFVARLHRDSGCCTHHTRALMMMVAIVVCCTGAGAPHDRL